MVRRGGDPTLAHHDTDFVNPAMGNWTPHLSRYEPELAHEVQAGILADEAAAAVIPWSHQVARIVNSVRFMSLPEADRNKLRDALNNADSFNDLPLWAKKLATGE